jgi:hypothetical protein
MSSDDGLAAHPTKNPRTPPGLEEPSAREKQNGTEKKRRSDGPIGDGTAKSGWPANSSSALPGIPVTFKAEAADLVDGGSADNLPAVSAAVLTDDSGLIAQARAHDQSPAGPSPEFQISKTANPGYTAAHAAFAARLQSETSPARPDATSTAVPETEVSAGQVATAVKKIIAEAAKDPDTNQNSALSAAPTLVPGRGPEGDARSKLQPSVSSAGHSELQAADSDPQPSSPSPVKDIALQLRHSGSESVDIRLVQQGNELRVAVHSADAGLTHGLRQGLSDLMQRMQETGYRVEVWRPAAAAPAGASAEMQSNSNNYRNSDPQPQQQGSSQQQSGQRNQQQASSRRPRWMEEMEFSMSASSSRLGVSHGIGS